MHFNEEFLHFIWKFRLFTTMELYSTGGEKLEILHPGISNPHAGPDFSQAKLKIGKTTWAGNVEIHIRSSDWSVHQHQHDRSYDSIILHVIYEDDEPVYRKDGSLMPAFVLKHLFAEQLLNNYNNLLATANSFPCQKQIGAVDPFFINGFLPRLLAERLEQKSLAIYDRLDVSRGNWDEVFYHFIAKNFGFKVNALPFELLAASIPSNIFAKHKDHPRQIEALIFGQAGFLKQTFTEEYPRQLQHEYLFLQKKYRLKPIDVSLWKFLRMRPQNFPTVRLAQFAALIINADHLFSRVIEIKKMQDLKRLFENLPIHQYWKTHYHFGRKTHLISSQLGGFSVHNLIINTVCLFLFAYGRYINKETLTDRALYLLEHLPAEKNSILEKYEASGVVIVNAFQSQSILQLNKNYCTQKKCLNCVIGIKILNR